MEVISNSVEDKLIDGLSYKLEPTASYITERKSSTFWAMGSNIYAPNSGTKVIKLVINGDGWLDPSTVKVQFDLKNLNAGQPLRTLSGPWSSFRRMRVLCQGQLLEDIDWYNRTHQMFHVLQSKHVRDNEDIEGFEHRYDSPEIKDILQTPFVSVNGVTTAKIASKWISVMMGSTKTVTFTPLSGLLSQGKMLPLRYCPLTIELEVVNNLWEPIISDQDPNWSEGLNDSDLGFGDLVSQRMSSEWQIENPQVKADVCRMDNQLENEFAQRFLSGQSIPVNFSTYIVQQQALAGQTPSLNITRAISKLKSVFLTLVGPRVMNAQDPVSKVGWAVLKNMNDFYSPMCSEQFGYLPGQEFEVQLQIGSKKFPEYPLRTQAETFASLRKCLGINNSTFHSIDITGQEYRLHKFIVGLDTEKVLQASFSGENLKSGSLLTLMMKNLGSESALYPTGAYVTMQCDCIMNIRDTGVELLD